MFGVEPSIITCEEGVAAVAKDGLDEIEVADKVAGGKETHLKAFFADEAFDFRNNNGPQEEGNP